MKRREDVLAYLGRVPLFSACTNKDLQHVEKYSERITVPAGTEFGTVPVDKSQCIFRSSARRRPASVGSGRSLSNVTAEVGMPAHSAVS